MKNLHKDFPSDLFVCLAAVDARIHIGIICFLLTAIYREFNLIYFHLISIIHQTRNVLFVGPDKKSFSPEDFLDVDLKGKIILGMELKALEGNQILRTYKVMPRVQVIILENANVEFRFILFHYFITFSFRRMLTLTSMELSE